MLRGVRQEGPTTRTNSSMYSGGTRRSQAGGLFENLVVVEALKARLNAGKAPDLYFIRDKAGLEIDLALDVRRRLRLFEIKRAQTPDDSLAANLRKFAKSVDAVDSMAVVYSGEAWPIAGGGRFIPFRDTAAAIRESGG